MSMKDYYDDYWSQEAPPPTTDGLTTERLRILDSAIHKTYGSPRELKSPLRLLDCGSGTGEAVNRLCSAGIDARGMDISDRAIDRARARYPGLTFFQGSVEDRWPVETGTEDIVVALEVIEHLLRPRRLLENAFEVLKPGGYIAISCPYHGLIKNLVICLLAFDSHFDCEGDHIRFFSQPALSRLLEDVGFVSMSWTRFGRGWGVWSEMFVWAQKPAES